MQSTPLLRCLFWSAAILFSTFCVPCPSAQVMQDRGVLPNGRRVPIPGQPFRPEGSGEPHSPQTTIRTGAQAGGPAATTPTQPAATPGAQQPAPAPAAALLPPSLLDKPAQPAKVVLADGKLSIDANNSSLTAILNAVETTSGMTVDGLGKDQRVFGQYGPGNPRDVLSSLLDGAGYNFMMVGDTVSGSPKTVLLTVRNNAPIPPEQASTQQQPDEDEQPTVMNYPPQEAPPAPRPSSVLSPPGADGRVKTPQEILQELERMRAQQQPQQPQ